MEKFAKFEGGYTGIVVGEPVKGWITYQDAYNESANFSADAVTKASNPFLLYFTSGTTALPSWCCIRTRVIRSGTWPPCTGSGFVPTTFT